MANSETNLSPPLQAQRLTAFSPIAGDNATRLILGSMPGIKSLEASHYYAHPRNLFWPVLAEVLRHPGLLTTTTGTSDALFQHRYTAIKAAGLALWDVLRHCERPGSLDSAIRPESITCNDFQHFFDQHPKIEHVLLNGKTAEKLFKRHVLPELSPTLPLQLHALPSTSPANASIPRQQKLDAWHAALTIN